MTEVHRCRAWQQDWLDDEVMDLGSLSLHWGHTLQCVATQNPALLIQVQVQHACLQLQI